MGLGADDDAAAACFIAFAHPAQAVYGCPSREVGGLDNVDQFVDFGFGSIEQAQAGIDGIGKVVGRDIGCHADGDAGRAVDEQCGETGRQYKRLVFATVVVRAEINGFFLNVRQHFM